MKILLIAFAATLVLSNFVFAQLPAGADTLFRYDRWMLLDVHDSIIEATANWKVYDVSYASPRIGRVTGFLVTPAEQGHYAGILFGHWGHGNRTEFLPEAKMYAQAGAVSLMIDYPWVRSAPNRVDQGHGFGEAQKDLSAFSQAVVDL